MTIRRHVASSLFAFAALSVAGGVQGCSSDNSGSSESNLTQATPHLVALSTYSASLGTPVDAFIANPPPTTAQKIELVFDGTFKRAQGGEEKIVSLVMPSERTEAGAVRWTTLGPFANPFTPTNPDVGTFSGKVGIKTTLVDGTEVLDSAPLPVEFTVQPSVIVTELQPSEASCAKPALKLIGQMSYKMKATTIGFKAKTINIQVKMPQTVPGADGTPTLDTDSTGAPTYRVTQLTVDPNAASTKPAAAPTTPAAAPAAIDPSDKMFTLPPVPDAVPSYGVVFAVTATDEDGKTITSTFGMEARRPVDIFYDGRFQIAQIYPPKPISACMPGGQQGRQVSYSEANTESKQRSLSVTLSSNWMQGQDNNWSTSDGKTISTAKTNTDGYSNAKTTSNSFTFEKDHSDTTGVSFTASSANTKGVNAKVSFSPFKIFGGAEVGGDASWTNTNSKETSSSSTNGTSQSNTTTTADTAETNHSTATTDSTAVTQTNTKGGVQSQQNGGGAANQDAWTVTSADTIQKGFAGQVLANKMGVFYRQMARYTYKAFVMAYDMCGEGDIIGDVTQQDYIWAPDLALSDTCPPLPKSNFPDAQCFLPPCDPQ